jgi:hypothetical protein
MRGCADAGHAPEVGVPLPENVQERYLEIREPRTQEIVTVVEALSPANKRPGAGMVEYLRKRNAVLSSHTNLVEIDLLRGGQRMPMLHPPAAYDYGVLVSRGQQPARAVLYRFSVRDSLPSFPLPLRPGEDDLPVDLAEVFAAAYDRGGFDLVLDYQVRPEPSLSDADAARADALLRERGLR